MPGAGATGGASTSSSAAVHLLDAPAAGAAAAASSSGAPAHAVDGAGTAAAGTAAASSSGAADGDSGDGSSGSSSDSGSSHKASKPRSGGKSSSGSSGAGRKAPRSRTGATGGGGGGGTSIPKSRFIVTNAAGELLLDADGQPRTYDAAYPSQAVTAACKAWRDKKVAGDAWYAGTGDAAEAGAACNPSAALLKKLSSLQDDGKITKDDADNYLAQLQAMQQAEVTTGIEVFIKRSSESGPKRYICHYDVRHDPDEKNVRARAVAVWKAPQVPEGAPAGITRVVQLA